MAKKGKTGEDGASEAKGGKGRLVLMAGLCVAMMGGGYVLGGRGGAAEGAATEAGDGTESMAEGEHGESVEGTAGEACTPTTEPPELGHVVDLEPMNVNLAEGHYLRVAVSLELGHEVELEEPSEFPSAPAKDIVVSTLSGRTVAELATPEGRDMVKTELEEAIVDRYHGDVHAVFLTEFVMQ
jgi:flagellar FliL protein